MIRFMLRRLALGAVVMLMVTVSVFWMFFHGTPKNVAHRIAGRQATPELVDRVYHNLGLDQPLWKQYLHFLNRMVFHADLGTDYYHGRPVTSVIGAAVPITFSLALGAAIIWLVLGVSSGVYSSIHPRTIADRSFTALALFFYSIPVFVLGLTLIYFLFFKLTTAGFRWFPAQGYAPISSPYEWARHLILPWLTLALISAAVYTRLSRTTMLEVLGEDYIRTARAKGLRERRVVFVHALRSAMTPVVTQFGIDLATVLGGAILTESVFGLPGLGYEAVRAITDQNLPLILGVVIVAAAAIIIANIVVDMLYAVLDPRVRLH